MCSLCIAGLFLIEDLSCSKSDEPNEIGFKKDEEICLLLYNTDTFMKKKEIL